MPRAKNFSEEEKDLIIQFVRRNKEVLESKRADPSILKRKNLLWQQCAYMLVSEGFELREPLAVKQAYIRAKQTAKVTISKFKKDQKQTGGGESSVMEPTETDWAINEISPEDFKSDSPKFDSDYPSSPLVKSPQVTETRPVKPSTSCSGPHTSGGSKIQKSRNRPMPYTRSAESHASNSKRNLLSLNYSSTSSDISLTPPLPPTQPSSSNVFHSNQRNIKGTKISANSEPNSTKLFKFQEEHIKLNIENGRKVTEAQVACFSNKRTQEDILLKLQIEKTKQEIKNNQEKFNLEKEILLLQKQKLLVEIEKLKQ